MRMQRIAFLCGLLGLGLMVTPAFAGCDGPADHCWAHAHRVIYRMHERIAFLEANPDADDGYKGPIIDRLHRKTLRIRAAVGPRWPHWPTPCCYSRKPIFIR